MLKWTPKSQNDLEEIMDHITKNFNIDLAVEIVHDLVDHVESILTKNPLAGSVLESNPLFSKLVYKGSSIYYCENPKDKKIYVVYVHPKRTKLDKDRINKDDVA